MACPLTFERLKQALQYDPATGIFTRTTAIRWAGRRADLPNRRGYRMIRLDGGEYQAHRIAWLYHFGEWPSGCIDHINCDPADNRIINLRIATISQNTANRRTMRAGLKGAVRHAKTRKWQAQITKDGRTRYLGLFETELAAHDAYMAAARELHGEFARAA